MCWNSRSKCPSWADADAIRRKAIKVSNQPFASCLFLLLWDCVENLIVSIVSICLSLENCCIATGSDMPLEALANECRVYSAVKVITGIPWVSAEAAAAAAAPGLCSGLSVLHSALSFMRSYSLILANALSKWITVLPGWAERKQRDREREKERERNIKVFKGSTIGFSPAPAPGQQSKDDHGKQNLVCF